MKKIVSFIMVFIMSLMLVACGEASTVTIKYETNGGNTITSTEIKLDDLKSFNLPSEPSKEGYEFAGWYLDSDFKEEFKSLDNVKKDITLYAKWEEQSTVYTVKFVDGEEELNTVSIKEGEKVLAPTTPTKEGYEFAGWYDGENLFDFETVITKDLVLTAKWNNTSSLEDIKSVSGKIELTNKITVTDNDNLGLTASNTNLLLALIANSKTTLELTVNNVSAENPKDIEAYFNGNIVIDVDTLNSDEDPTFNFDAYVKEGKIYIEASFYSEDLPEKYNFQIDAEKLIKALEELAKEAGEIEEGNLEEQYNLFVQEIQAKITEILAIAAECGIDTKFYNDLVSLLKIIKPTTAEKDDKIVYTVTNEQVQNFLTSLGSFIEKYIVQIYMFGDKLNDLIYSDIEYPEYIEDDFEDEDTYKVIKGENGWYDAEGTFHSFAEDEEELYGFIVAGYYVDYEYNCVYDTNNNYALVEACFITGYDTENEEFYYAIFFKTEEGDYFVYEYNDEIIKEDVSKDFSKEIFGYVNNEMYCTYYNDKPVYYDLETGRRFTDEEVAAIITEERLNMILSVIEIAKESITINKFNVSISKGLISEMNGSFTVDVDMDFNIPEDGVYNVKELFSFSISSDTSSENKVINFPSFDEYTDVTDMLIGYLQQELE